MRWWCDVRLVVMVAGGDLRFKCGCFGVGGAELEGGGRPRAGLPAKISEAV